MEGGAGGRGWREGSGGSECEGGAGGSGRMDRRREAKAGVSLAGRRDGTSERASEPLRPHSSVRRTGGGRTDGGTGKGGLGGMTGGLGRGPGRCPPPPPADLRSGFLPAHQRALLGSASESG